MNINKIRKMVKKPYLYESGNSIMWTDPYISKQLLKMHIDKNNDMASRNPQKINKIINWILKKIKKEKLNVLDLGCGPGLYSEIFAKKGHIVTGIDYSANSIKYAIKKAKENNLSINYLCKNYLELDFNNEFDLVILIYLDFCVLLPKERDLLLKKIFRSLKKGGIFVFDVVNEKNIEKKIIGHSWEVQNKGFWKDSPYVLLTNGYHYPEANVLVNQHIVIDEDNNINTYLFWSHYYKDSNIKAILKSHEFINVNNYENILPEEDYWTGENISFYIAKK